MKRCHHEGCTDSICFTNLVLGVPSTCLQPDRPTRAYVKDCWYYRFGYSFETSEIVRRFIASLRKDEDFKTFRTVRIRLAFLKVCLLLNSISW